MADAPPASSVVQGPIEPSLDLSDELKSNGWIEYVAPNGVCTYRHPGFDAIARDIEQRRERIARKLEP